MALTVFLLLVGVSAGAWSLTGLLRRIALKGNLLDIPNQRSSHTKPAPRGGGLAIVLTTLVALPFLAAAGMCSWMMVWSLGGAGAVITAIGLADDVGHLAAPWRLVSHFAAAVWVLGWFHGLPHLVVLGHSLDLGWLGNIIGVFYIVWLVNLTNFMDGIDGIAGVETISVCLGGIILYRVAMPGINEWIVPLVLMAATFGFLIWNWPPAKIFLGDAGSGFLGLAVATLSLEAAWIAPRLLWSWIVLVGVFVADSTVTLIRRVARGEKFYEAHRTHAYQHAVQRWGGHLPVTLAVAAINVGWLLPIAVLISMGAIDGLIGSGLAYTPLLIGSFWLRAGKN